MKTEVKVLIVAGLGYMGLKAYQIYTAIKNLTYYPTGIRLKLDKSRGGIGGTIFFDINNPTTANVKINSFNGTVALTNKIIIGTYRSSGVMLLKPGINKLRLTWDSRNSLTIISTVLNIITKKIYPVLRFSTIFNIKGVPVPTSFEMNTADFNPVIE
jgi:hypothetical protein